MQITFNIPQAQVQRIMDFIRDTKFPGWDNETDPDRYVPTNADIELEFRNMVKDYIRGELQQYELLKQHEATFAAYTPIEVND